MEKAMENWDRVKESWTEPSEESSGDRLGVCEVETPEFHEELCLFCLHMSSTFDENMAHMETCLSIPAQETQGIEPIAVVRCLNSGQIYLAATNVYLAASNAAR